MSSPRPRAVGAAAVLLAAALSLGAGVPSSLRPDAVDRSPNTACGAGAGPTARSAALEPGEWMSFDLEPAVLDARFRGTLRARNFTLVGDFEEITIEAGPGAPPRNFQRRETVVRDGVTMSVFDLAFPYPDYRQLLSELPIRFDCLDPACAGGTAFPYRMGPVKLPKAAVVRIDDRVQYSSHVVNVVAPYETRLDLLPEGDRLFSPSEVATIFYQRFEDSYEELTLIPSRTHASPASGAVFDRIHVDVQGIAVDPEDRRQAWGGSELLRHATTLLRGDGFWNYLSLHETAHHWGFQLDLFEVAGLRPQRGTECLGGTAWGQLHQPLLADQPSFLSHCLVSPLCIQRQGRKWRIAEAPAPLFFHPLQAYAMGLLEPEEVPPVYLRRRQDRPSSLRPGDRVSGGFVEVTVGQVIDRYGPRVGPGMPPAWRRATIVVSPERLLDRDEMAWYNFLARRISDPEVTGVEALDRTPSMEVATAGAVDLRTEIRPLQGAPVRGRFAVSYPKLGRRDLAGVQLARKLPTRFRVGRSVTVAGRVSEPAAHREVRLRLGDHTFVSSLDAAGRFSIEVVAVEADRGPQWLTLALGEFERLLGSVAPVYVD